MTFDFKNASREELQHKYNAIAKETGDDQFFTKKELHHLPGVLSEGEQVLAFTSGLMGGNTWLITVPIVNLIQLASRGESADATECGRRSGYF